MRFDNYVSGNASEAEGVIERLSDKFPKWSFQWSLMTNNDLMIKHRNAGGVHAGYNNTMKGGISIVTGHTHGLEVKPWGDYRGRRWGVRSEEHTSELQSLMRISYAFFCL